MLAYDRIPHFLEPTVVALGFFDGVHLGHAAVLEKAVKSTPLLPVVFTFQVSEDFPLAKGKEGILFSDLERRQFLEEKRISAVVAPPFSAMREMDALGFVQSILLRQLSAKRVVCGANFRFGKNAAGNVQDLQRWMQKNGVETVVCPPVKHRGELVSSSKIRRALLDGRIRDANSLLGRPYSISSKVVYGKKIGHSIGIPTINQEFFPARLVPKYGVYASAVQLENRWHMGVTNIGRKPTVQLDGTPVIETHIPFYQGNLYGRMVTVALFDYLREEKTFSSLDALRQAIALDIDNAKKIWKNQNFF